MVAAESDSTEDLFELKPSLGGVYDQIENDQIIIDGVLSSQPDTARKEEGQKRLNTILDGLWDQYGSESLHDLSNGRGAKAGVEVEKRLRDLADGRASIPVRTFRLIVR
jgi:hypothetical protein